MVDNAESQKQTNSKKYLQSLSKNSKRVEIAELKCMYEEQLESKNSRITKLEHKNQEYLEIIAAKPTLEKSNQNTITQIQEQYELPKEVV